ncbi:hypothetical protein VTN77DRAFT_9186 [Rasamsonia byssochlamydoides]|uniref:uncharacterized protein n=1 Tax=Rasamsonia byssochlamydoides TaxID=89139 RepID=UPI003743AF0D
MGQTQSTGSVDSRTSERPDYYKILGLERDASEDEIRRAYRKKALELHPDRNYGNVEASTKLFAEIQCAYEVLSDPQERAWYDSHRDAIFTDEKTSSGEQAPGDTHMMSASDILALFFKFSPQMEFSDSSNGFFGGLRETFERIAREEKLACRWDKLDPVEYPSFGRQNDDFEEVVRPFYAAWSNFSTKKSFAWKDVHRYSEAPDRRIRRLMEKENRRLREEAIREYNDAVRSLVAFVKKRDPRYKSNLKSEAERQRMLRESAAAQAARSRAANQAKLRDHVTPEWARAEEPEEEPSSSSESDLEQFECVVCRKIFKSEKQFEAHERSKKHIKAVKQLRLEMTAQNEGLQLESHESMVSENVHKSPSVHGHEPSGPSVSDTEEVLGSVFDSVDENIPPISEPEPGNRSTPGSEDEDNDYTTREAVEARMSPGKLFNQAETLHTPETLEHFSSLSLDDHSNENPPKMGKAKQKRAKKAARTATVEKSKLTCASCHATFPSRTKLFAHIKELGHAQPVNTFQTGGKKQKR